jgi:plasmid maintenance system antidote protein VapI
MMPTNFIKKYRLVCLAHGKHGFTLKDLSKALGVHHTTISKVINSEKI